MMNSVFSLVVCVLLVCSFLYGCTEIDGLSDGEIVRKYDSVSLQSHFGFMHPDDFEDMTDMGVFWQRPHPGPFIWGEVEINQGVFDWERCDKEVMRSQQYGVNILATVWPFADWDQESCHDILDEDSLIFNELGAYRQLPCDMNAYRSFVMDLVERYDGDGVDDMQGLVVPIKFWEVSNEPSMQRDWLVFFAGSAAEYFEILKTTYEAVKAADSNAIVVAGGMAGVMEDMQDFWAEVFSLGGMEYFDIGNIHSINSDSLGVNAPEYQAFLDGQGVDVEFWVTEVELGSMDPVKNDNVDEDMPRRMVTSFVLAFASGADKIFYPGIVKGSGKFEQGKEVVYDTFVTLVEKLDYFESVEKLDDGQYSFVVNGDMVYVLWGDGSVHKDVTGRVRVTDFMGNVELLDADEIVINDSPVFVEKV
jgi:hypothetical protein